MVLMKLFSPKSDSLCLLFTLFRCYKFLGVKTVAVFVRSFFCWWPNVKLIYIGVILLFEGFVLSSHVRIVKIYFICFLRNLII